MTATQPISADRIEATIPAVSTKGRTQMIIGKFQQKDGVYTGAIAGLVAGPVRIAPSDRDRIDYIVKSAGMEFGLGWKRTSDKGNAYVSIMLDSPFLPAPANCALVKQDDGYVLLWDREKPRADKEAA